MLKSHAMPRVLRIHPSDNAAVAAELLQPAQSWGMTVLFRPGTRWPCGTSPAGSEMFGAEQLLMDRCADRQVFEKPVNMINGFK